MATGKKVALVTGANRGIGLETARQLGQKGVTVVVGRSHLEVGGRNRCETQRRGHRRVSGEA